MTTDEFLDAFRKQQIDIVCNDSHERQSVIRCLLDNGFQHGSSGYSEHMMRDIEWHPDNFLIISVGAKNGLEFYRDRSPHATITGDEVIGFLFTAHPQVDDLI